MADWARLHPDMLSTITKQIKDIEDLKSFRSVCSTWRSATLLKGSAWSVKPPRCLVLQPRYSHCATRTIYSFAKDAFHEVILPEETRGKWLIDTKGWILTVTMEHEMSLIHPFSQHVIPLPPQTTFGEYYEKSNPLSYIQKGVLSSNPGFSPNDYVLMVIHSSMCRLGFWKPGEKIWTMIKTHNAPFKDIIHFEGQFYAIDDQGMFYVCDVSGCNPKIAMPICRIPLEPVDVPKKFYLAGKPDNHSSVLVIVQRVWDTDDEVFEPFRSESSFKVYGVDLSSKKGSEQVHNLGDRTIFVSHRESVYFEHSKFPPGVIQGDRINYNPCPDKPELLMSIYNLRNGFVQLFRCSLK